MEKELARGRKFRIYSSLMDAAIEQKIKDVIPWVKPGIIVDAGFGTGLLLFRLWERFRDSKLIGIDLSSHFFEKSQRQFHNIPNVTLLKKNIIQQNLPNNSVDTKIFSTILHEVYSYNGCNLKFVKTALKNSLKELKPSGRIIIRDGVKPESETICLSFKNGDDTETMFLRFAKEYKHNKGIKYKVLIDKWLGKLYCTDSSSAYEFLSKKDYRDNWHIEVNEQFGYLTLKKYMKLLQKLGFKIIYTKAYLNPWILKNRWLGKVKLYRRTRHELKTIPYPNTNLVIIAEKQKPPKGFNWQNIAGHPDSKISIIGGRIL
ncbi:MAG: methyltransferase domain-containing protein [Candidatus Harrisonbacteria bacterium]|nr:methyltransferase domain-containing protein [Candidatus Harrisonbacteria bacterium]